MINKRINPIFHTLLILMLLLFFISSCKSSSSEVTVPKTETTNQNDLSVDRTNELIGKTFYHLNSLQWGKTEGSFGTLNNRFTVPGKVILGELFITDKTITSKQVWEITQRVLTIIAKDFNDAVSVIVDGFSIQESIVIEGVSYEIHSGVPGKVFYHKGEPINIDTLTIPYKIEKKKIGTSPIVSGYYLESSQKGVPGEYKVWINLPGTNVKSVSIPSVDIQGIIHQDGTVEIIEKRTMFFEGLFNNGSYDLLKSGSMQIAEFTIAVDNKALMYDAAKSKITGSYFYEDLGNFIRYHYFYQANNATKTFTYRYIMKNSVDVYEDYGQFYYLLQGPGWNFEIGSFTATIKWDKPIPVKNYRIWAHGPSWGDFTKTDEYSANLKIESVPPKTMVEVRLLLPKKYFSFPANRPGRILDTAIKEETK